MNRTPQATREQVIAAAKEHWFRKGPRLGMAMPTTFLFAVRGYWPVSMGPTSGNDPGVFDDAWFLVTPDRFLAIPANTDPSRYGWNSNAGKPMAVLQPGWWPFYRGAHKGKIPALRQFTTEEAAPLKVPNNGKFRVMRTYAKGDPRNYLEDGYFAINCHSGGIENTSSEGCQTASSRLFKDFMTTVWEETRKQGTVVWYGLIDGPIN